MSIRKYISIVESDDVDERLIAIEDGDWKEALDLCDTPAQVAEVIQASGARQVQFRSNTMPPIWILGDDIIDWDGKDIYPELKSKNDWIYEVDPTDYFPDHDTSFNADFWYQPRELYHATVEANVADIEKNGLQCMNKTRGITNRGVGSAVFTTSNYEETLNGSYGDFVFEINTEAMAADGYKPYVGQEPPIVEAELRGALAHMIGMEDFYDEGGSDMSEDTVIVYGNIPAKYLTLLD